MPRGPRLNVRNGIYHVMARGNRKATIFTDDHHRERFMDVAAEAAHRYAVRMFAENRVGNHYHQIVQTPRANLPDYMAFLNGTFARLSNHRNEQIGHVFNERYKPVLVEGEFHLKIGTAYVLTNAVKHGFVKHAGDWRWSSYRATVGLEPAPSYLCLDWLRIAFPSGSIKDAQARLLQYLHDPEPKEDFAECARGPALGSSAFERELREHIGATLYMSMLPRSYRALGRPPLVELFQRPISKSERDRQMLRAHVLYGYRMSEIAQALYMHPTSVSRIVSALRRRARTAAVEHEPVPG
jgi:putative transposase